MHIAILGTRGIPNHYGGFEQFAEYLSVGLVKAGYQVTVYNSHTHPFQGNEWNGVSIVHRKDPEDKLGTFGQFLYDFNCIRHARNQRYDIILILGYTSSSIWGWYYPRKRSIITTNMDGLEWKRTKYSPKVRRFLTYAEKLGAYYSDHLIADSVGIQQHLQAKYNRSSVYIPYGATIFEQPDISYLNTYGVAPYNYDLLIARLEPENSIETILDGKLAEKGNRKFLVIGKHETKFGEYLKAKYANTDTIIFLGGIYNIEILNNLRYYSNLYFHGHTVGGTNPSLLEAMASNCFICAHDNVFNKSILGTDALYFSTVADITRILTSAQKAQNDTAIMMKNNIEKISTTYSWAHIIQQYMAHFEDILARAAN